MKIEEHIEELEKEIQSVHEARRISVQRSRDRIDWLNQNKYSLPNWLYDSGVADQIRNISDDFYYDNEIEYLENKLQSWKNRQAASQKRKAA